MGRAFSINVQGHYSLYSNVGNIVVIDTQDNARTSDGVCSEIERIQIRLIH